LTMFKALRMQMDELGMAPDYRVNGLAALPTILSAKSGNGIRNSTVR
jgi:2-haloacid dehalogenase